MIITVTLNPALDKTAFVQTIKTGELNRLSAVRLDAGGKGINVSGVIKSLGGKSLAVFFAGGGSGGELLALLERGGLDTDFVNILAATRTNLKLIDSEGALTELNEPGPQVQTEEWQQMEKKLASYAKDGNIIVLSGSLPQGLGKDTYKTLTAMLRSNGATVFLDADGEALKLVLDSPPAQAPNCIKPNRYELAQYFGIKNERGLSAAELIQLCRRLLDKGVSLVALSMGADGAIFVNKNGAWKSSALDVQVRSSVAAGDSMVGALAYGFEQRMGDERCFALAMAASAAACTTEGTAPPSRELVQTLLEKTHFEKC